MGRGGNASYQHFLLFLLCFLLYHKEKMSFKQCFVKGIKILLEKEKMLVTSIFFFSYSVFYYINYKEKMSFLQRLSSANAFNLVMSKTLSSDKC